MDGVRKEFRRKTATLTPDQTKIARTNSWVLVLGVALLVSIGISAALEHRADLLAECITALETEAEAQASVLCLLNSLAVQGMTDLAARVRELELGDRA